MAQLRIFQYLQTFDKYELNRLLKFAESSYFCTQDAVRQGLNYLSAQWADLDSETCSKAAIFTAVFPGEAYEDKRLRYLLSDTCRVVEQFWTGEQFRKKAPRQELEVLTALSTRGLNKLYDQRAEQWRQQQAAQGITEPADYYFDYAFAAEEELHFERQRVRKFDLRIQQAATELDRFYFLQQLTYACGMLDRQTILRGEYDLPISDHWLRHLEAHQFFDDAHIELYYVIYQMQCHETIEDHFHQLRQLIDDLSGKISKQVMRSAMLAAINYCARSIRRGLTSFLEPALNLYRKGIEDKVLFDEGVLSPWTFNNVVKLALRLERFSWIESFMQTYQSFLPESFRSDALYYNQAELYYYTHRYQDAQQALLEVSYTDLNFYLGARVLLAKIYYETEETESLLSLLAAFQIFLKRNKDISLNIKKTYLHFCEILYQIVRGRSSQLPTLEQRIKTTSLLTDRDWLLRQLG